MRVCVCVIVCVILCCRHARAYQQFSARASRPHSLKFQVWCSQLARSSETLQKATSPNTVAREKSKTAPVTGVHGFITHVGNPRLLLRTGAESGQRQGSMLPSQRPPRRTDGFAENVSVLEVSRLDVEDFVADHYLGVFPSASQLYLGIFYKEIMVGMLIYGSPTAGAYCLPLASLPLSSAVRDLCRDMA